MSAHPCNSTDTILPDCDCTYVGWLLDIYAAYCVIMLGLALLSNGVLVTIVSRSLAFASPSNTLLMSLCLNNVILAVVVGVYGSSHFHTHMAYPRGSQPAITLQPIGFGFTFVNYIITFASVAYYRSFSATKARAPAPVRKQLVRRQTIFIWTTSLLLAVLHATTLVFGGCAPDDFANISAGISAAVIPDHPQCRDALAWGVLRCINLVVVALLCTCVLIAANAYRSVFGWCPLTSPQKNRVETLNLGAAQMNHIYVADVANASAARQSTLDCYPSRCKQTYRIFTIETQEIGAVNSATDVAALSDVTAEEKRRQSQQSFLDLSEALETLNQMKGRKKRLKRRPVAAEDTAYNQVTNWKPRSNHPVRNSLITMAIFVILASPWVMLRWLLEQSELSCSVLVASVVAKGLYALNSAAYVLWYLIGNNAIRNTIIAPFRKSR